MESTPPPPSPPVLVAGEERSSLAPDQLLCSVDDLCLKIWAQAVLSDLRLSLPQPPRPPLSDSRNAAIAIAAAAELLRLLHSASASRHSPHRRPATVVHVTNSEIHRCYGTRSKSLSVAVAPLGAIRLVSPRREATSLNVAEIWRVRLAVRDL
ncbi:hypothetical protein TIFTF001_024418 [Ficus carica]|uniref:Uncharacterized protein n=1 Tax=Ficus carica TaxID=3494 RepID=A0AA88ALB6_FICCA|nr:hypothetical protein TIFTF001_024418 [Ficus carica]